MKYLNEAIKHFSMLSDKTKQVFFDYVKKYPVEFLENTQNMPKAAIEEDSIIEILKIAERLEIYKNINISNPEILNLIILDMIYLLSSVAYFIKYGKKVVSFKNETIKEKILNTASQKITFRDIKTPFKVFYVNINEYIEEEFIKYFIDGCLVENRKDGLHFTVFFKAGKPGAKEPSSPNIGLKYFSVKQESDVESVLSEYYDALKKEREKLGLADDKETEAMEKIIDTKAIRLVLKYAVGAMAYIAYAKDHKERIEIKNDYEKYKKNPFPPNPKKLKKAALSHYHYIITEPKSSTSKWNENKASKKQYALTLVRGHFRKQPYGPRENPKYKIIWIEPFWKNLDGKEKDVMHKYII